MSGCGGPTELIPFLPRFCILMTRLDNAFVDTGGQPRPPLGGRKQYIYVSYSRFSTYSIKC